MELRLNPSPLLWKAEKLRSHPLPIHRAIAKGVPASLPGLGSVPVGRSGG